MATSTGSPNDVQWWLSLVIALLTASLVYWVISDAALLDIAVFAVVFGIVYAVVTYITLR